MQIIINKFSLFKMFMLHTLLNNWVKKWISIYINIWVLDLSFTVIIFALSLRKDHERIAVAIHDISQVGRAAVAP